MWGCLLGKVSGRESVRWGLLLGVGGRRSGERRGNCLPVVVGVEMESAKVDVREIENRGEIFPGSAVVVEVPVVGSGSVVEEAVPAKGDEVVGVDGFDVAADVVGPCC